MAKNIVICLDGTWNDPTERTNVYKLFRSVRARGERLIDEVQPRHLLREGRDGVAFYLEGVGARGRSQGLLGGTLGVGLHTRVIHAFLLASAAYRAGDKFWIFGFSRGAWAARSLAGLIARAGLLDSFNCSGDHGLQLAQETWVRAKRKGGELPEGKSFWERNDSCPIRLVGVWDTVGALGVPFFNGVRVFDTLERHLFDFADLTLSDRVAHGRQALAIDETRKDFAPTLWQERSDGTIRQVWFAGAHGDVGGGYRQTGLSDLALGWMVREVQLLGGETFLDMPDLTPEPAQDRHDEAQKKLWQLRPIEPRALPMDAVFHAAVTERLTRRADYRPKALAGFPAFAPYYLGPSPAERLLDPEESEPTIALAVGASHDDEVFAQNCWNATGIVVKRGERYRIVATGQWSDKDYMSDPDGYASPNVLLKTFEGGRRLEKEHWFRLIACVHADPTLESHNPSASTLFGGIVESALHGVGVIDAQSQLAAVGKVGIITVDRDGYLYLFANDCLWAYGNNSGYLAVSIDRVG